MTFYKKITFWGRMIYTMALNDKTKDNRIPSFTLSFESILPNFDKPSVKKKSLLCALCTALGYLPCLQTNSSQGHQLLVITALATSSQ